jgi:HSP20 family protein
MANLTRRRETEPSAMGTMGRFDPFRTFRDLLRWDPFGRDMGRMLDLFPELDPAASQGEAMFMPNVEVKETQDAFVLKIDLPGVRDEDVEVSISGNRMTVTGRREEEDRREGDRFYSYERSYGIFSRSFSLPEGADMDKVKAELDQGVLTLNIPKKEASQARRISLASKGEQKGEQTPAAHASAAQASTESQASGASEEPTAAAKEEKEQTGQRRAA